jgi:hypothetical protein
VGGHPAAAQVLFQALAGGAAGLLFAYWTIKFLIFALTGGGTQPEDLTATLEWPVLLFALGVSAASGLFCGLYPAWEAARSSVADVLKDQSGQSSGTLRSARVRKALVCAQVAISALLLIPTGLFLKSLVNLTHVDLGMDTTNVITFRISPELCAELEVLCRAEGATLFMGLLAAFQTLLSRYSGQDDIVVGTPIANRQRHEFESLIGLFVNTLVIRTDLSGSPSFRDSIRRVRDTSLRAYAHQDVPFDQLVAELQPERDPSRNPLFQVMFSLQNMPWRHLELPGLNVTLMEPESRTSKFYLCWSLQEENGATLGSIEYDTDLFDSSTIARMERQSATSRPYGASSGSDRGNGGSALC